MVMMAMFMKKNPGPWGPGFLGPTLAERARFSGERVGAQVGGGQVFYFARAISADEVVVAELAVEGIVASAAVEVIIAYAADEHVIAIVANEAVVAFAAEEPVVVDAAGD